MTTKIIITNPDLIVDGMCLLGMKGEINKKQTSDNMTSLYIEDFGDIFAFEDEFKEVVESSLKISCEAITKKGTKCTRNANYVSVTGVMLCGMHAKNKKCTKR